MQVVIKVPRVELVERLVTFLRTPGKIVLPAKKEVMVAEDAPAPVERVPMMFLVDKMITYLKTSERDPVRVKRKSSPVELTGLEQRFCRQMEFDLNAAYLLKELTGGPLELLEQGDQECSVPTGICSLSEHETARKIIREYQDVFIAEGKFMYIADHSPEGDRIAIMHHCTDPFKVMNLVCTSHHGVVNTEEIVAKLKNWHERFGVRVTGIGHDFCEAELLNKNIDYRALSEEVYNFSPAYRICTLESLEEELKREGTIRLQWD